MFTKGCLHCQPFANQFRGWKSAATVRYAAPRHIWPHFWKGRTMKGVRTIFFRATMHPEGTLTLVHCEDNTIRILCNGEALECCCWEPEQLDDAVAQFTELQRILRTRAPAVAKPQGPSRMITEPALT
jgi:hypothetical protein